MSTYFWPYVYKLSYGILTDGSSQEEVKQNMFGFHCTICEILVDGLFSGTIRDNLIDI